MTPFLLSPCVLACMVAISPTPGGPAADLRGPRLQREATLPPATPVVVPTTAGAPRGVRPRTERHGAALLAKVRLHAPATAGAVLPPPPVMIRHPKATPGSSRDPTPSA